jgi:predicted nucleotidyltransferase
MAVPKYDRLIREKHMTRTLTETRSVQERIEEMVRRIVSQFQPDKIILFGSHARGEAGPDSDVDLLVVMQPQGAKMSSDDMATLRSP